MSSLLFGNLTMKKLVKKIDPGLLRSRKRGKRAGVRLEHSHRNGKVPLPAIVLTNGLDEHHGLLQTKRLHEPISTNTYH